MVSIVKGKVRYPTKIAQFGAALAMLGVILLIGIAYLVTTLALLVGELVGHVFLGYLFVSLLFHNSVCCCHEGTGL